MDRRDPPDATDPTDPTDPIEDRLSRAGAAWRASQPAAAAPMPVLDVPRRSRSLAALAGLAAATLAGLAAATLVLVAVVWTVMPRSSEPVAAPPSPVALALLTADHPSDSCRLVLISGRLVPDAVSGLGIRTADGASRSIRWPFGYRAVGLRGRMVLLDAAGEPVALDGDPIGFGEAGRIGGITTACDPALTTPSTWTPDGPADVATLLEGQDEVAVGARAEVVGWLARLRAHCAARPTGVTPERDPSGCGSTRIADQPWPSSPGPAPAPAIRVQDDAWDRFGADSGLGVDLPRYGTWQVRRTDAGWEVVARLDAEGAATADKATVTIVEVQGEGALYIEGYQPTITVDGPAGRLLDARREQHATRGPYAWPPGRVTIDTFVEPCVGSCDELDPPVDGCRAELDVAAGERWRIQIVRRAGEPCTIEPTRE